MSDRVTNVEIEDVLSSIRKLVADDARVAPTPPVQRPGRLVLTPAQRVPTPSEDDANTGEAPHSPEGPSATDTPMFSSERTLSAIPPEARLAEFGEVENTFPDADSLELSPEEAEREAAAEEYQQNTARMVLGRLIEEEVAAALRGKPLLGDDPDEEDTDSEDAASFDDTELGEVDAPPEMEASKEHSLEEQAGPSERLGVDTDKADAPETTSEGDTNCATASEQNPQEPDAPEVADPPQTLEDKVAALGRLVARGQNDFEEERDNPDADEFTATAEPMTWPEAVSFEDETVEESQEHPRFVRWRRDRDKAAQDRTSKAPEDRTESDAAPAMSIEPQEQGASSGEPTQERPMRLVQRPVTEPFKELGTAQEAVYQKEARAPETNDGSLTLPVQTASPSEPMLQIDEDMLRDVVGDMVRQELQGALGERITRNVRKLVRREIHRMLISQELE